MIKSNFRTINEYINTFPRVIQAILEDIRQAIRATAPNAVEISGYQIPTIKLNGNLVHFAAYQNHVGFYPSASGIRAFKKELSSYELSRGAVRFPLNRLIPLDLIKKIVIFRVKENLIS